MNERQVQGSRGESGAHADPPYDWESIPGFFPRRDIPRVIHSSIEFYLEARGTHDGVEVFKVFRRRRRSPIEPELGIPVDLSLDGELLPLRARLLPIDDDEPVMAALIIEPDQRAALARIRKRLAPAAGTAGDAAARVDRGPLPAGGAP
jgi:hypothetical protein